MENAAKTDCTLHGEICRRIKCGRFLSRFLLGETPQQQRQ
ncbi:hypothetical protein ANH9381_0567 [Aggregatibacter actinomycetemcomitans ANH9381]|nr:hypothetical protein ANH9381_0567 [Aggregatibacter actinomycetemcomitans ANH9381]